MIYVFDLDGTICSNTNGDYSSAKPFLSRIAKINDLYSNGHVIILSTARGMGRSKNNAALSAQKWKSLTIQQLNTWGVSYHELYFGKPAGDFYVDDKAISDSDFFSSV
jgi:capsule biosynthesis phosphatase